MKRTAKIVALLLSGCIMLSSSVLSAIIVEAADDKAEEGTKAWNGSYDTSWYDEQDTELHVFTAEELAGLAYLVNEGQKTFEGQTIFLESDIDLSGSNWIPIGQSYNTFFKGTLDGKGHIISNLSCTAQDYYYGVFGNLSGTVRCLSLENCKCSARYGNYASLGGGIASILTDGIIENCKVSGSVQATSYANSVDLIAGGVAGKLTGNCEIRNCSFYGNVSLGTAGSYYPNRNCYAGGICGAQTGGPSIIDGCSSDSKVYSHTGSYEDTAYAGGICGAAFGTLVISNSYKWGFIVSDSTRKSNSGVITDTNRSCAGGIIGYISPSSTLENVYNVGTTEAVLCGGIAVKSEEEATLKNVFYLTSSADKGVALGKDTTIAKSASNMKKEEFAKNLGDSFVYVENSYPKLAWELEDNPVNTDPAITEMQLKVGESTQMTVTNYTGSVTWISQNPEIATITSDGVVTGLKPGKASIFAILDSGKALSGTIQVVGFESVTTISSNATATTVTTSTTAKPTTTVTTSTTAKPTTTVTTTTTAKPTITVTTSTTAKPTTTVTTSTTAKPTTTVTTSTTAKPTTTAKATTTTAPVTTTTLTETTPVVTTSVEPAPLRGDIDGDGAVSVEDAQLALKSYTNRIAGNDMGLTDKQIKAADVNDDGELSVDDAQNILIYYVNNTVAGNVLTWEELLGKQPEVALRPQSLMARVLKLLAS